MAIQVEACAELGPAQPQLVTIIEIFAYIILERSLRYIDSAPKTVFEYLITVKVNISM